MWAKVKDFFSRNLDLILTGLVAAGAYFLGRFVRFPGPVEKGEPRHFNGIDEFTAWYNSRFTLFWLIADPRADCDDYAEYLQRQALRDGFIISLALLKDGTIYGQKKDGEYYGVKVTSRIEPHAGALLLLGTGAFWYVEPQTGAASFIVNRD